VIQLGILVSLSEISPSFCIFRITGNPYLGNLSVESFTSNILILDPCFFFLFG
jgi:hypothetical protein